MRNQVQAFFTVLFSALLMPVLLHAHNFPSLQFSHLDTKDGLTSNNCTAIAEDRQGFIWIGTSNGLNRYDGYRFQHYYHSSDKNSLVSNDIQAMYCDSHGRLWICTNDGVSCFIPGSNRFINYAKHLPAPMQLKNNSSVRIYEDEQHRIWLCNQVDVIYQINDAMEAVPLKIDIAAFPFFQEIKFGYDNIFRDNSGNEWAFTSGRLYRLNKQTKQPAETIDLSALLHTNIIKMMQGEKGSYLLGTWGAGVWNFDPATRSATPVTQLPKRIFNDLTRWSHEKKSWLLCLEVNYGVYLLDQTTNAIQHYGVTAADPTSLQGTDFHQVFSDSKKNTWICSNAGINLLTMAQHAVEVIPVTDPGTTNYSSYKSGPVFSYLEADSSIWMSKRYVSTFEFDEQFTFKNYYSSLYPLSATKTNTGGYAYYFYKKEDDLYISTDSGLVILNQAKKTTASYNAPQLKGPAQLRTIISFGENELLIRSFSDGLFVFNTTEKKFSHQFSNRDICSTCTALKLTYLFRSTSNEIYVCAAGQYQNFLRYNALTNSFVPVVIANGAQYPLQAADIFGVAEDAEHNLWLASAAGVFIFNPATGSILKRLPEKKEMGSLFRLCFDNAGNLWGNSVSGIWCYTRQAGRWIGFNNDDGLPGSNFEGIIAKRPNGDILAGLEGAVAIFHPGQLFGHSSEPPVVITEASAGDSLVSFPLISGQAKKLLLQPGQNSFVVDFAILNYVNPASSRYYYKLAPLMKEFQLNSNGHINFNGLAPGTYTLYVKGGNKTGIIFSQQDALSITVLPFWYQSGWFRLLCVLAIAAIISAFVKWRIMSVKKQALLKQQIAEIEMQALRAQMNPHFIFNSLNSIENFMMQNEKRLASDYLNKFSRLIRSILDSSRNEMVPVAKDMEALQWYVDLQQLRLNNKFIYQTNVEPLLLQGDFKVPSLLVQPFVENAIEHGLSHSDQNDLYLKVTAVLNNEHIVYTIEDNGIGRQRSAAYNLQNKPHHKSVGLSITTDRLRILNEEAYNENSVQITDLYDPNNQPCGTRVTVKIKAH